MMPYDDLLEPNSMRDADTRNPPNEAIQLSIAISLKRIADRLDWLAAQPKPSIFEQTFGR